MRVNSKDLFIYFIWIALTQFIYLCNYSNLAMGLIVVETTYIIFKAKYSMLSIFSFLVNYCLLVEFFAVKGLYVYGLLGLNYVDLYYFDMYQCCSYFSLLILMLINSKMFLTYEKEIYNTTFNISITATELFCVFALIITILIFPSMPGKFGGERFSGGIIPFTGWSCIPFFFLSICILGKRKKSMVYFCTITVVLWYVLHGERVEAMGLIAFFVIWIFNTMKLSKIKQIGIVTTGMGMLFLMTIIGVVRSNGIVTIRQIWANILVQTTACDVTNVFNCAADLYKSGNAYNGQTYLSYIINCIPYLNDPYSFQTKISENGYLSAGGGVFIAEPFANGGLLVVILVCIIYMSILKVLVKRHSFYTTLIYIELFLSVFRIAWYGLNYPIITILYFVPFVILVNKLFTINSEHSMKETC